VIDTFAAADSVEDPGLFVVPVCWNEDGHWLTHGLLRGISEEKLSAATPTHEDAGEILGKDRVDSTIAAVLRGAFATQTLWECGRSIWSGVNLLPFLSQSPAKPAQTLGRPYPAALPRVHKGRCVGID
jgi:hypothetical protein